MCLSNFAGRISRPFAAPDAIGDLHGQPAPDDPIARVAIAEGAFHFRTGALINIDGGQHLQRL